MNKTIEKIMKDQHGFITADDVEALLPIVPQMEVLVRTGGNRCTCPIEALETVFAEVASHDDYVRDVSFTAPAYANIKKGKGVFSCLGITWEYPWQ